MNVTQTTQESGAISQSTAKTVVNVMTFLMVLGGTIFKMMHWEGADMLILTGTLLLLISVVFLHRDMAAIGNDSPTTGLVTITMVVLVISTLFKRMHWEGGLMAAYISVALIVLLSLVLILKKEALRLPKQFGIFMLLYLIYIAGAGFVSSRVAQVIESNMP